jgi:SUN domain-containing protein 1/2
MLLAQSTYHITGPSVQTFPVNAGGAHRIFQLRITSNHGNPDFTCLYRFMLHGEESE